MTVTQPSLYLAPLHNTPDPIRRVLIANRGEIALRVARTCALLGIESVAVYVEEDARSPHVAAATTAVALGPVVPADPTKTPPPYLDADLLIRKAIENDCDAIHPGYGYLSENPDFADAVCRAPFPPSADGAGPSKTLRFIGPSSASMREMGDKAASKSLLRARLGAEAPLVPGYDGADQDVQTLVREAKTAGFPILLKASAGGGGKGMRVVRDEQR